MGTEFELSVVLPDVLDIDDPRIETIIENWEGIVDRHGGDTVATLTIEGSTVVEAAVRAVAAMFEAGIDVERTYPDLVDRQDIADRAEVSRQAVGNWVRGERSGALPFPAAINHVGGGIWLWHDVNEWLRARKLTHIDDVEFPTLAEHTRIDFWIAGYRATPSSAHQSWRSWEVEGQIAGGLFNAPAGTFVELSGTIVAAAAQFYRVQTTVQTDTCPAARHSRPIEPVFRSTPVAAEDQPGWPAYAATCKG